MKKLLLVFLVVFLIPVHFSYSQVLPVIDAAVEATLSAAGIDQLIHYAQTVQQWVQTANHWKEQIDHMKFEVERTYQNLTSLGDIKSFSDFMDWYNRELYYERKTAEAFQNANISIGGKNYSLYDLEGIIDAVDYTYIDYWNREFTDDQRREMWLGLGLTPANYAYVMPFREKAREISREMFFAADIQNEWYERNMERNNERQNRLADDKNLDPESPDKLTEKELLMMIVESLQESNKVLNDVAVNQAMLMELQAAEYYLDQVNADAPILSDWPADGFRPLN